MSATHEFSRAISVRKYYLHSSLGVLLGRKWCQAVKLRISWLCHSSVGRALQKKNVWRCFDLLHNSTGSALTGELCQHVLNWWCRMCFRVTIGRAWTGKRFELVEHLQENDANMLRLRCALVQHVPKRMVVNPGFAARSSFPEAHIIPSYNTFCTLGARVVGWTFLHRHSTIIIPLDTDFWRSEGPPKVSFPKGSIRWNTSQVYKLIPFEPGTSSSRTSATCSVKRHSQASEFW